jgi:hypothetical protein
METNDIILELTRLHIQSKGVKIDLDNEQSVIDAFKEHKETYERIKKIVQNHTPPSKVRVGKVSDVGRGL